MFRADAGLIEVCVNNFQGSEMSPGTSSPAAQGSTTGEQASHASTYSENSCDGLNKEVSYSGCSYAKVMHNEVLFILLLYRIFFKISSPLFLCFFTLKFSREIRDVCSDLFKFCSSIILRRSWQMLPRMPLLLLVLLGPRRYCH